MKNLILNLFAVSVITFGLVSCTDEEVLPTQATSAESYTLKGDVSEYVQMAYDYDKNILASALLKTGLDADLKAMGPVTIFAPGDDAFVGLLSTVGQSSLDDLPTSVLREILLNHVVKNEPIPSDMDQPKEFVSLSGNVLDIDSSVQFEINLGTAGLYSIDNVMVPSSVATFVDSSLEPAYFNKNFTSLVSAVVQAGLVDALLSAPGLTIFAPTNDAFAKAGIDLNSIDAETLQKVLSYHVVGAKVMSGDIPREAITLNGTHIFFSTTRSAAFINGNAQITAVDISSGNAVVHVVDEVLLPASGTIVDEALALTATGEFTMLVDALLRTAEEGTEEQNLINVLSSEGPFSVFAPTNAAFTALLDSNESWSSIADIPLNTLVEVLTYHVVPARAYDKDLLGALNANNELPTALGKTIEVDLNTLSINGSASIIGVNTHALNGVIHVIDQVLLPSPSFTLSE
jgi:transforming growth factor-beta-induced protein